MTIQTIRSLGSSRGGVWVIGHIVSPLQRWLYQASGGRISLTGRAPVLLLTTTGRRSGQARTVPLFYLRDGDRLVVCNVRPPHERTNPWVINLDAHPDAEAMICSETSTVRARLAHDDEVARYWPELVELWPAYQHFYDAGGKRSIFVLEPTVRR